MLTVKEIDEAEHAFRTQIEELRATRDTEHEEHLMWYQRMQSRSTGDISREMTKSWRMPALVISCAINITVIASWILLQG